MKLRWEIVLILFIIEIIIGIHVSGLIILADVVIVICAVVLFYLIVELIAWLIFKKL